jgi:UPF0755 protein
MKGLRFFLGFLVFTGTLLIVLAGAGGWWAYQDFKKPGPLTQATVFEIKQGSGLRGISYGLAEAGIIHNAYVFMAAAKLSRAENDLKAGEYEFEAGISAESIMHKIRSHDVVQRFITIPEGLTSHEIVALLNAAPDLSGVIADIPKDGSLLPETYDYSRGEERQAVIGRMKVAMDEAMNALCKTYVCGAGDVLKSQHDVLTLAAIIEKETGKPEERPAVAGVFINRLKKGMALQTDPTVIYAITGGKPETAGQGPLGRRLLKTDLAFESPYNTYLYPGLPPGPIANPGKASIEAALNPQTHDYLYFVADGTGGHLFAKTLDEHNKNVANWRKVRDKAEKED